MEQPPLDHHYVVMHLGGAKHVSRRRDGPNIATVAENGSLTMVPAGTAYAWQTEGPIAFAHLYIAPRLLGELTTRELERDGGDVSLIEQVGARDPLLEPIFATMIDEVSASPNPSTLRLDSLHESFCIRLARNHTTVTPCRLPHAVVLAPHRLRRVLAFIDAHLGRDISLGDLVAAAGTSQYHFSRAFQLATGCSPYHFVLSRRIDYARVLLITGEQPLDDVAAACGFQSRKQFAVIFKREVGMGPKRFRMAHAPAH